MRICETCGARVEDSASFCPVCGAKLASSASDKKKQTQTRIEDAFNQFTNTTNTTADYSSEDIAKNKLISIVAYLGVFFIIPLFVAKDSPFARFHTNQGLLLFLFSLLTSVAGFVPYIGWILAAAISIFTALLMVVGILNVIKGEAKELPVIGKFKILK